MPTVISDDLRFAFLHVPKTGGTTIGQQIASQVQHDGRFFEGVEKDPELGEFYQDHLTMRMYAKHYASVLEKLRTFDVYAVVRDPFARFRSALAQFSRLSSLGELSQLPRSELRDMVGSVIAQLERGDGKSLAMIFFRPQAEFVALNGELIARRIFDLSDLNKFSAEMAEKYQVRMEVGEYRRKTPHYRRHMFGRVAGYKNMAARILPAPVFDLAKQGVKRVLRRNGDPEFDDILARMDIHSFVRDYYKEDYDILENQTIRA